MATSISVTQDGSAAREAGIRRVRAAAFVAVAFALGNAGWAAWDQGPTYDEYYHVEWPRRLLRDRVDERESAFRFDSKTPVLLPSALAADAMAGLGFESDQVQRFTTRLTPLALLPACLWLVFRLARPAGESAAWIALLLAALDPNLTAHASIATSDLAYAGVVLLFAWSLLRDDDSWRGEVVVGGILGVAFAVKFTSILLLPVAAAYGLLRGRTRLLSVLSRLSLLGASSCLVASALYLGVGVFAPLGTLSFHTPSLRSLAQALSFLPLPFPRSILTGIDLSIDHNAHTAWACYFFGSFHPGGAWHYFAAHWLMKTPVALGFAILIGLAGLRRAPRSPMLLVLATLFFVHLIYFSFFFSTQIGYRFALACVPLASILAALGLAQTPRSRRAWLIPLLLLALAERAPYLADPIAFTNLVVWPKSRAWWFTADSNLDYGQNRNRVDRYVKESGLAAITDQTTVTPGLYVINANNLTIFGNYRANRWLIDHEVPAVNFGFTDFGFSITGDNFEAYMNEARLTPSLASFDAACGGELPHYAPGRQIPFSQTEHPDEGRLWVVCARSRKGVDLGFKVTAGRLHFGRVTVEGRCATELLEQDQMSWARVPAGGQAQLCLHEIPFRRSFLPYLAEGYLVVRGQGADIEVRRVAVDRFAIQSDADAVQ